MGDGTVTRGGRTVGFRQYGADTRPSVLFMHGAPGSRAEVAFYDETELLELGVCVVGVDRPGYGLTDDLDTLDLLERTRDALAVADALHMASFAVQGVSSGGKYALACAALAPHRVRVVVLTGATGQLDDESLADMSPEIAASWREELYDAPAARVQCDLELREMCDATDVAEVWLSLMAHMTPPELDFVRARGAALTDDTREAGRQGGDGWWRDNQASGQPWPFDPSLIRAPIYLFHGDRDRWAPLAQVRRAIAGTNVQETVYAGDHLSPWTTRERRVAMLHATQSAVTE